jgi:hypothetical protein
MGVSFEDFHEVGQLRLVRQALKRGKREERTGYV